MGQGFLPALSQNGAATENLKRPRVEKPTRVSSPARGRSSPGGGGASTEHEPQQGTHLSPGATDTSTHLSSAARAASREASDRPGATRPPRGPAAPPRVPPPACSGSPAERQLRDAGHRGEAQDRAPALPQGSRGRRGASSRAAATRRLPRPRAPEPGPTRGSARAQCSRPGCAQASALGPAHAPAFARLRLCAPAPLDRRNVCRCLQAQGCLEGFPGSPWRAVDTWGICPAQQNQALKKPWLAQAVIWGCCSRHTLLWPTFSLLVQFGLPGALSFWAGRHHPLIPPPPLPATSCSPRPHLILFR